VSVVADTVRRVVLDLLAAAFLAACVALVATDLASWGRTAPLRRGRESPPAPWRHGSVRSSPATLLAAVAGALALAWGTAAAVAGHMGAIAVLPCGAFVGASGLRSRVTGLEVLGAGLRVRYAAKPEFFVSWGSLRGLHPPGTPLGAWRIDALIGAASLMPSDLLGNEGFLRAVICLGALSFDGRAWVREKAPRPAAMSVT
jgi:hypothetical protein